MSLIPSDIVKIAYKKLKRLVYYEKPYLLLRKRLSEFECADNFNQRLEEIAKIAKSKDPAATKEFQSWLDQISYVLVPKSVKCAENPSKEDGTFVTNVTSAPRYYIERINYIFDAPIEIHIIGVLWLMTEGHLIDRELGSNCLGSRLHPLVGKDDDHSAELFKKYHELYALWRDEGISKAEHMLVNEERSVCIMGLDLQEYYYRIQIDWNALQEAIKRPEIREGPVAAFFEKERLGERLFTCITSIISTYNKVIYDHLIISHRLPSKAIPLPIGFCASPVVANWYLKDFDKDILSKVRPAYYSRYVDDILLVVATEELKNEDPIKGFMEEVFVKAGVMQWNDDSRSYSITSKPGLLLQRNKCNLQYFEAGHSIAGLEKFRKELEEHASNFALLPTEEDQNPVGSVAYELLYDGPVNKLRSVKEIAENRWELAKHLSKQTQLYLITGGEVNDDITKEIFRFFKGRNAINYWDMWERVLAFLMITGNDSAAVRFLKAMEAEINKMRFLQPTEVAIRSPSSIDPNSISSKLRQYLHTHISISIELCRAVRNSEKGNASATKIWRSSNLIRHHLVAIPLLNYTNYTGDLCKVEEAEEVRLDWNKIEWSPRFVHFDECLSFIDAGLNIQPSKPEEESIEAAQTLYKRFHGSSAKEINFEVIGGRKEKKGQK